MPSRQLLDEIKAFEEFQAREAEEEQRLSERLAVLEEASREHFQIVANDNNNSLARQRLDEIDREIEELKKEIRRQKEDYNERLRERRSKLLASQESVLNMLNEKLRQKHDEQTQLRTKLIPETEQQLATLRERDAAVDDEISQTRKEINRINKINLDSLFAEY